MQVIEDQQQRLLLACPLKQTRDGGIEQIALCLGIALGASGQLGHAIAQGGYQTREITAMALDLGIQDSLRSLLDEVSERLHHG